MNILFLTIGSRRTPSTRFRVKQYFPLFERSPHTIRHVPIPHATVKRIGLLEHVRWADVVFLQKKLFSLMELELIKSFRRPILFDMDDVVFYEHPLYAETRRGRRTIERNRKRFQAVLGAATTIIAGNTYLAENVRRYGYKAEILPTPVDTDLYRPGPRSATAAASGDRPVIGWIGTGRNLYYLDAIKAPLLRVLEKNPQARLRIVTDSEQSVTGLPAEMVRWSEETEIEELGGFTIGIMPLTDDIYSQGKCGFKLLQYMSLELPTVSSPIGVNTDMVDHGRDGFLASTEDEWVQCLETLLGDGALGRQMGALARQKVVERYSVTALFPELCRIIEASLQCFREGR